MQQTGSPNIFDAFVHQDKHAQMTTFLKNMQDPTSDQQKQMQEVLLGGRGQQKRLYAVDKDIYGTEEAARLQKEAQEKAKKGKRRKKRKGKNAEEEKSGLLNTGAKQSAAAVAVVGVLAAGASIFLGGRRST